ncbi:MBG domain-containing protein [Phreatobacter sp. AB_2022a]|uniref:MBG domain-containing protein n=1 Tax=Phreatobacter sp. AB_2022a TaxID=3003134 RepID=UPI002286F9AA|nr:MBG domain-containing protein [Phreatobacter sp. AB_2022a]MCZ0734494.1 MBG domain-containing protein [Phreatobacter sp. AB_2022a]
MGMQRVKMAGGAAPAARIMALISRPVGRHGATRQRLNLSVSAAALLAGLMPCGAPAQTLPSGGTVAAGTASIGAPQAGALTVNQSSQRAVINWNAFSVGAGGRVTFQQPGADAATLNRVTGSTASTIAGQIQANGQVYLVNPNGILITPSGTVDTAGFTASTLATSDQDFMAGRRRFTGTGASADVTNQGTIRVRGGGDAVLIGGRVTNEGTIAAPGGRVGLAAGEAVSVDVEGDGFLTVSVPTGNPDRAQALIRQTGRIRAQGGRVEARAATSADVARAAIQLGGTIEAGGVAQTASGLRFGTAPDTGAPRVGAARPQPAAQAGRRSTQPPRPKPPGAAGTVVVDGGAGGTVSATGRIDASSPALSGGAITITGRIIDLAGARIDASGGTSGGQIRIGGDYQGGGSLPHAETVAIDGASTIRADALGSGDGGRIIVWSDRDTRFAGTLSARGGPQGGDGGFAEVSSKGTLAFTGMADMRAALGRFGTLLLDPYNIVISNAPDAGHATGSTGGTTTFTPTGTSVINVATLQAALNSANVTITTGGFGSPGTEAGDITVASAITWSSGSSLTLSAYRNIAVNAAITNTGGATIDLRADNSGMGSGTVSFGAGIQVSTTGAVNVYYNPASNPPTATPSVNATSYTTGTDYSGNITGGGTLTAFMLVNTVYDLQNVNNRLTGNYALGRDIDASVTSGWNSGAGFKPIGNQTLNTSNYNVSGTAFSGIFDGLNQAISNLTINRPTGNLIGLFTGNAGIIRNLGVTSGTIIGGIYVGGLVGQNNGTILNSFSGAAVEAARTGGGLVGNNDPGAVIRSSYATGNVTGSSRGNGDKIGGLVGYNGGNITGSYASGNVWAYGGLAGGLVGQNNGSITQAYATGSVYGYTGVGGLVGGNSGPITQAYATGAVSASYMPQTGGLIGYDVSSGSNVTNSYWDTQTTGMSNGNGAQAGTFQATGLTTAQFANVANMPGLTFGTTPGAPGFVMISADGSLNNTNGGRGAARPFLLTEFSTSIGNAHQLQLMALDPSASYRLMRNIDMSAELSRHWFTSDVLGDGYGFMPVAANGAQFTGQFDGGGHTIANLVISRPSLGNTGLFGLVAGTIGNVGLVNAAVTGAADVGALAGTALVGSSIINAYSSGTVSGASSVGGLVGVNRGTISRTYSSAAVTGIGADIGGLVGDNSGAISQSYATGAVGGASAAGGLAGRNSAGGTIADAYATGAVSGGGGLVGDNSGSITRTYATGAVTGAGTGGLAATNSGTITNSYWDTTTSGKGTSQGVASNSGTFNASGLTTAQLQDLSSYQATFGGWDFQGVWAPPNQVGQNNGASAAHYPELYAFLTVLTIAPNSVGRFYGDANPTLTATYYGSLKPGDSFATLASLVTSAAQFSNVGDYSITASGASVTSPSGNAYRLIYIPGTLTVNARPLTISADAKTRIYGDTTDPALTYRITSGALLNGDQLTGELTTSANATRNVGVYAINLGTLGHSNYAITYVTANETITARPITVTADAASRHYGDANPTFTYTVGGLGLVNGNQLSGALATAATAASGVGSYAITLGTLANPNYDITSFTTASLGVTARPITVAAAAQTRPYGDANPTLTYTVGGLGLANGDTLGGSLATAATAASGVGNYAITAGTLGDPNYQITSFTGASLGVTARPITIVADARSRVYGDANPALTYSIGGMGLANGDSLTGGLATAATSTSNVGSYAITQGDLAASSNYAVTYVGAGLAVTQRAITVTADARNRIYGDANPALTWQVTSGSLAGGDSLTGGLATTATGASNVGSYPITQGDLAVSSNYALTYVGASLTVTQRAIAVTADAKSRAYGDANPTLTWQVTIGSLAAGDSLTGNLATAATGTSAVGSYAITQGDLAASPNYILTYVAGHLAVTPRALTITADAKSRTYGDANPALTYSIGGMGLVNGDGLTGGLATAATSASNVGAHAITQGDLAASSNYAVTYVGASLAVTQRAITITADAKSRTYGDANPALTYSIGGMGLAAGDSLSGGLATAATSTSNVGSYAITQGDLAASSNYAVSYVGASLTIAQRAITVTADAASRAYGEANPTLTWQVTSGSLAAGDSLTGGLATTATSTSNVGSYPITQGDLAASSNYALTYAGASLVVTARPITITADARSRVYGEANPALTYSIGGMGLANGDSLTGGLATAATGTSNAGSYAITQGDLAASSNYALTYAGASLAVTQRAITVTADARSRIYGDANPALTYSIGGMGLANGDSLTGGLATTATSTSNVGSYAITQGDLAASANYALTYAGASLAVTQRAITVTANAGSRIYGEPDPALTWQVTGGSLVNGDSLAGSLATAATGTSHVGTYAITQGTLGTGNYAVTFVGADLAVTARTITVTADAKSRIYGEANPALTYGVGGMGLVNGDTLSGALATAATGLSGAGTYAIALGSLANANYTITGFAGASLTVTPRPVTITALDLAKSFGQPDPALAYSIGGMGLVNGDQVAGALAREAGETVGSYAILQGSLALSPNYLLTFQPGRLSVSPVPAPVSISQLATLTAPAPDLTGSGGTTALDGLTESAAAGGTGPSCRQQPSGGMTCP